MRGGEHSELPVGCSYAVEALRLLGILFSVIVLWVTIAALLSNTP